MGALGSELGEETETFEVKFKIGTIEYFTEVEHNPDESVMTTNTNKT
jgi:hypothetical protein